MIHHTKEPWVVALKSGEKWATAYLIYTHDGNKHIAICNTYADVEGVANSARIVACINGCAGLNPAAYRQVVEALKEAENYIRLFHIGVGAVDHPDPIWGRIKQALALAQEAT